MTRLHFLVTSLAIAVSFCLTLDSKADIAVFESTTQTSFDGGVSVFNSDPNGDFTNPSVDGVDFGTLDLANSDTFVLQNFFFKNDAFDSTNGASSPDNNWINPNDNFATLNLTVGGTTSSYQMSSTGNSGTIYAWDLGANAGIDLMAGLGVGTYDITYNVDWSYNSFEGTTIQNSTTHSPEVTAAFTIVDSNAVPEPTSIGLIGLLGLTFVGRRRRS